jgi:sec-independent protein translocase protein TatA
VGNLGFTEIMVILLVVLLLFGAKRLPEVGSSIGKGIREFKRSISDTQDAIMNTDEQRTNLPSPPTDSAQQPKTSTGEPKRLSQ